MDRLAFKCALALLFLRFSYLHETITFLTGINTYVLYIFGPIAFFGIAVSGGVERSLRERIGKYWLAFLAWMAIDIVFSSWPGGSASDFFSYLRTDVCMFLITAGLARTWKDCRQMIGVIALATIVNLGTAHFFMQTTSSDRLALSWGGTIANSNDLAAHLLLAVPFVLFYVIKPKSAPVVRILGVVAVGLGLYQILHTGSRGALVALAVTAVFVLITGSARQRVAVVVGAPVALIALVVLIPSSTWKRLTSFSENESASDEALESSAARQYLFRQSLIYTLHHPVFGVGPGQFSSYEGGTMTSQGMRGNWHETHNTYTQVSSECGLPALFFYLGALFSSFGLLVKTRKAAAAAGNEEIATAAFCLLIGMVAYTTATVFVSFAYRFYLPAISGLIVAIWAAVNAEVAVPKPAAQLNNVRKLMNSPRPVNATVR